MKKKIILITGIGLREPKRIFKTPDPAELLEFNGKKYKTNAATWTAIELSKKWHIVYMSGSNQGYLDFLQKNVLEGESYYSTLDLKDLDNVQKIAKEIEEIQKKHEDCTVNLVYYGGMSGKDSKYPSDCVCNDPFKTPAGAVASFFEENLKPCFTLMQGFEHIFKSQDETKIIFISAISATRTGPNHSLDGSQKSAIHAIARSFALDLTKHKIYVSEVMPGITDSGFYDTEHAFRTMMQWAVELGYTYKDDEFPVMKSERIGQVIDFILESPFHVREISFMPYGQYPQLWA